MNVLRLYTRSFLSSRSTSYEGLRHFKRWLAPTQREITRRKKELGPQPVPKRSAFIEWNREAEIYAFNKRLNEKFDLDKLDQAFIYKSYVLQEEEKQKQIGVDETWFEINDNESFILKGEKLTSKAVYSYLMKSFPRVPEAGIRAFHDYLTSQKVLAEAASNIGSKDIILTMEHPVAEETLASTFLALVGALAESVDDEHAAIFVRDFLITALAEKDLLEIWCPSEPLQALDAVLQQQKRSPAEPRMISHTGNNTILSSYQIAVYSDKQFLGSGFGQTIQEARDIAATNALCRMFGLLDSSQPLRFNTKIDISL